MRKNFIIVSLILCAAFQLNGCGSGQADTEQEVSSSMRQFVIEPEEEAIYLASVLDMVPREEKTVSGNSIDGQTSDVSAVFAQVNQMRAEIGLEELSWNDELAAAADIRAKEIQTSFSHTRPDGSSWWTVNSEVIYGENLAKGYQSAESVMEAWMASSEHKDNILYSGFKSIGIAVYESGGKWYWAQEFGY